jgi:Tfp pilus assembly protein PilV
MTLKKIYGNLKDCRKNTKGISIIESLVSLVIIGIGFIAINQMIAFSSSSMNRSMDRTKVNFLTESAVEDIMGDADNADDYNFVQQCSQKTFSTSNLSDLKKNKWANIFTSKGQIVLGKKERALSCVKGDEKKASIRESKNSGGKQALFNFKTGKGNRNKFIGVVVK